MCHQGIRPSYLFPSHFRTKDPPGFGWSLLRAEFGNPRFLGVSPATFLCGTTSEWVCPHEAVSMCECVWLLYPEAGRWGCWAGPGEPRKASSGTISPSSSPALMSGPHGTSVARRAGGHVYLAPWGPGHMPRPTRAPLPLLSPEPPRFIKEPKDQIGVSGGVASFVCQATGDPKPRVTWNKKGKKVNSQRFEVSGWEGRGHSPGPAPPPDPTPTMGNIPTWSWLPLHRDPSLLPPPPWQVQGDTCSVRALPGSLVLPPLCCVASSNALPLWTFISQKGICNPVPMFIVRHTRFHILHACPQTYMRVSRTHVHTIPFACTDPVFCL